MAKFVRYDRSQVEEIRHAAPARPAVCWRSATSGAENPLFPFRDPQTNLLLLFGKRKPLPELVGHLPVNHRRAEKIRLQHKKLISETTNVARLVIQELSIAGKKTSAPKNY